MAKKRKAKTTSSQQAESSGSSPKETDGLDLQGLRDPRFRPAIDDLLGLLAQNRRAFLIAAGCSKCAGLPLMDELTSKVLKLIPKDADGHKVLEKVQDTFSTNGSCNIEDYMSEIVDLVSIADRRTNRSGQSRGVSLGDVDFSADMLRKSLEEIKNAIKTCISDSDVQLKQHREFVRAIHGTLQSGKVAAPAPIDYFTLNYDTLLEDALSLERVNHADGFLGGPIGWWDSSTYASKDVEARVFKIHGSIDWTLVGDETFPRRLRPSTEYTGPSEPVMIWPASTKYREAQRDPHAQVLEQMRRTLRPHENCEVVLAIAGYSFGDSHINYEIDRALRESDGRLTIVVFTSDPEPRDVLKNWSSDSAVNEHVRIHANRGFFHAGEEILSNEDLPWWRFEILVQVLRGNR